MSLVISAYYRACFPFLDRFSAEQQDEFLNEFILGMNIDVDDSGKIFTRFKLIVVFARK